MTDSQTATMVEEQAADWLERMDRGDWSEADQSQLDAWLEEAPAHMVALWRLDGAWSFADRLAALRRPGLHETLLARGRGVLPIVAKAAAGIALIAALGTAVMYLVPKPAEKTFATEIGGRKTLELPDGSRIELNTGTQLRLATDGAQRKVWLDKGEAFFDIKHDASRPFVVITAGHRITDLGTKFVVREAADSLEVTLVEGRARFESADTAIKPQLAFLSPGDVVVATATSMDVTRKSKKDLSADLGWRRGVLIFQHTTLAEAAAEFNRYNTQRLVIGDEKTASLQINGTFKNDDAASFAGTARAVFGLKVEKHGDEIVLSQ
jgi:transmembrane sensor